MNDYIKSLEQQNEELKSRLEAQETYVASFNEFLKKFLEQSDVVYYDCDVAESESKHLRKISTIDLYYDLRKIPPYLKDLIPMLEEKFERYKKEREAKKNNGFVNVREREQDLFKKFFPKMK